jgi:hypothetical protein
MLFLPLVNLFFLQNFSKKIKKTNKTVQKIRFLNSFAKLSPDNQQAAGSRINAYLTTAEVSVTGSPMTLNLTH